ncbi:hypothetical protein ABID21_001941 [Pseudorhizobium tarimense]|uniref:Uncharacterized protein n=1 Tax=Pseudorhizobium tarimense TaxID=1079109 RepID=A0ABV2H6E6_9HYPH|nr:hypothetical protein [Pseudorhizobium tarimense]MCJ8519033.1 hypothetical protein [Pseudorhizobium tarimense]
MSTNLPYRRVDTFSDDAITVRLQRRDQRLVGVIDFPSFQRNGKMIHASTISPRPLNEAFAVAEKILPHTPFAEIVILFQPELRQAAE